MSKLDDLQIRWLIRRDMPEVLQIERGCFDIPWNDEDFMCCLREKNCIGMVADSEGEIVGFMVYELYKFRLRILNFAVKPAFWRMGVGHDLAARLIDKLHQQRRSEIRVEVREQNIKAQKFFAAMGFKAVDWEREYYDDESDAIVMQYSIDPEEADWIEKPGHNRVWKFIEKRR